MKRKTLRTLFAAAVAALGICRVASAGLVVELHVTSVSGPAILNSDTSVLVSGPGARIEMDLWAWMTNASQPDDGIIGVGGALVSWGGDIRGPLEASRDPLFRGPGSSDGEQRDYDGDGDLDIAGANDSSPVGFFVAKSNGFPNPVIGAASRIGHVSFLVDNITSAVAITSLGFSNGPFQGETSWVEGGVLRSSPLYTAQSVTVSAVPEPAALALFSAVATFASALRPQRRNQN